MALKEDAGIHLLDAHALGPSGSSAAVEGDTGEDGGSGNPGIHRIAAIAQNGHGRQCRQRMGRGRHPVCPVDR